MSLDDWNLSSDEEEGFDEWTSGNNNSSPTVAAVAAASNNNASLSSNEESSSDEENERKKGPMTVSFFGEATAAGNNNNEDEDDDEDDDIDWEDGGKEEEDEADGAGENQTSPTQAPPQLKPVTVEISIGKSKRNQRNDQEPSKSSKKRKRARRSYRHEHLAPDLQRFLTELQKTHLLSLVAHATKASNYCCDEQVLCIAHSILPQAWISNNKTSSKQAPTLDELGHFCNFFFGLVRKQNGMAYGGRYQKKNTSNKKSNGYFPNATTMHYRTPEYCSHISDRQRGGVRNTGKTKKNGAPSAPAFNCYDKVHLLIALVRSLGWRARYVIAFEPTKKDLDVNHPIFIQEQCKNLFQRVWYDNQKKKKKKWKSSKPDVVDLTIDSDTSKDEMDSKPAAKPSAKPPAVTEPEISLPPGHQCWVEILCHTTTTTKTNGTSNGKTPKYQWIPVDPRFELVNQPQSVECILYADQNELPYSKTKKKIPISYILAAEHVPGHGRNRLTDVTPRYSSSWTNTLKKRGVLRGKQTRVQEGANVENWWKTVLQGNHANVKRKALRDKGKCAQDAILLDDEHVDEVGKQKAKPDSIHKSIEVDDHEEKELKASAKQEPIPTSKTAFKSHPIYVIPSVMNANEVLVPDAKKRFCGIFKGEMVFRRTDVEVALPAKKWLYRVRKVRAAELSRPMKRVKARKKAAKGFQALKSYGVGESNDGGEEFQKKQLEDGEAPLEDGKENIYASWQTDAWSPPPVGPNDPIPVNEHKNVELELLNPGLVHVQLERIAKLAKKLGIPYAPCLLGFEGHGGNRTPTIRGIVVHVHNELLLREAHAEMSHHQLEEDRNSYERNMWLKWKRLLEGVLIRDRLEREYGDD